MKYTIRNHSFNFTLAMDERRLVEIDGDIHTSFISLADGFLGIKSGYAWDGSSIPLKHLMQRLTFGKYDPDRYCKEASLVHDALYQLMRLKLLSRDHKEAIDRLYEKMCISGATKIIEASYSEGFKEIEALNLSYSKERRKLTKLHKKIERQIARLPAWAARRYWAVKHFGARTLKPRYRPEKVILST